MRIIREKKVPNKKYLEQRLFTYKFQQTSRYTLPLHITFITMSKSFRSWIAVESDDSGPMHGEMAEPAHLGFRMNFRLAWRATSLYDQDLDKQNMHASADWNISVKIWLPTFPLDQSVMSVVHHSRHHCIKVGTLLDQCICKWMQSLPSLVLCTRPVFGRGVFHPHGG